MMAGRRDGRAGVWIGATAICDASAMRLRIRHRLTIAIVLLATIAACAPRKEPFARLAGLVLDQRLGEISGIAASRTHADVLWMANDGGNDAALYAVSRRGRVLARFAIEGVANTDWEDLAAFELDGKRYVLVADTGDNGGLRRTLQLHAIEEPKRLDDATLRPAWSIAFRWPGGARDCEAVAVDAARREVLLVSKKRHPAELYAVPLDARRDTQVARRIATLAGIPQVSERLRRAHAMRSRLDGQVTAADLSPDGRSLALMTYGHLVVYRRASGDNWTRAAARPSEVRTLPWIPQAEALAWSAGGRGLFATGEFSPAPLFFLVP